MQQLDAFPGVDAVVALWPEQGQRHSAYMALIGALCRAWPQDRVEAFVSELCAATSDDEQSDRLAIVAKTGERLQKGKPVVGWPTLSELLGNDAVASIRVALGCALTVDALAAAKQLPRDYLFALGVADADDAAGHVLIPYKDTSGKTVAVRKRHSLSSKPRWERGARAVVYGEDRLADGADAGYLTLCEGESDAWTLWYHGFPALGIPGAECSRTLQAGHVDPFKLIYIVREADGAGETFVDGVARRLADLGWRGELRVIAMTAKRKDVSALFCANPESFKERWRERMDRAELIDPPSVNPTGESDWPAPIPLDTIPAPARFPIDVLPSPFRQLVTEGAAALYCPPDYFAVPLLVAAAGALGNARALAVKGRHVQGARLYAAVIGPPGSSKSPALEIIFAPLHESEDALLTTWRAEMENYAAHEADYEALLKEWRKQKPEERGDRPPKPERPPQRRLLVSDSTVEELAKILEENPRGVTLQRDELSAWISGMDQYRDGGKGTDRQFWLSAWSGAAVTVDRKKTHEQGPLRIRNPFVGVIGGIVPDNLPALRGDGRRRMIVQDGFLDRVLLAYPSEFGFAGEDWQEIREQTVKAYTSALDKLRGLQMVPMQDGETITGYRPYIVKLTEEGRRAWERFTHAHADERNADDFPPHLHGPWAKMLGYCARFALLLHFLRWSAGETDAEDVDGNDVDNAARLVAYFKSHARRVYGIIDADPRAREARRVIRWLKRSPANRTVKKSDLHAGVWGGSKPLTEVDAVIAVLIGHGFLRPVEADARQGPGRKPSPLHEVHPSVFLSGDHSDNSDISENRPPSAYSLNCLKSQNDPKEEKAEDGETWEGEIP